MVERRNKKERLKHTLKEAGQLAAGVAAICILALPCAVLIATSYITTGQPPAFYCGTSRHRRRPGLYTEREWRNLRTTPRPEIVKIWSCNEMPQGDGLTEFSSDGKVIKHSPTSQLGMLSRSARTVRLDRRGKAPFRFLNLPRDLQAMILGLLVVHRPAKQWSACAAYSKDGFIFEYHPHAQQETASKKRQAIMQGDFALWRTHCTRSTTCLLLTSKLIRSLTLDVLGAHFSGTLSFVGRANPCLLATRWPWRLLLPSSLFVRSRQWLFDHVRIVETHHYHEVWTDMLDVMPRLEQVVLIPGSSGRVVILSDDGTHAHQSENASEHFLAGKFDDQLVQSSVEMGRKWMEWCKERVQSSGRAIELCIVARLGFAHTGAATGVAQYATRVELWPRAGQITRRDIEGMTTGC